MERGMKPRREAKLGKCETRWRGGIIWSGKLPPQRLDAISPCVQGPPRAQQRLAFREPRGRRSCDIPQRAPPDRHIFPGIRPGKPVARSSVFDQAQQVSGGKASVHGWRASFRSWCSEPRDRPVLVELMSIPRSAKRSSTFRSDSGYRTYIITTRRMTSGELLKYRNGLLMV